MSQPQQPTAKVLFRVPEDDGSAQVETLWATDLGNDRYELDNSPFYAYAVSWHDIVYAPFDESEQFPTFERVVSKSGNRTIRVIFDTPVAPGNASDLILQRLASLGCTYEGINNRYMAINIPPSVELEAIRVYLVEIEATWEQADPTNAQLFPDDA